MCLAALNRLVPVRHAVRFIFNGGSLRLQTESDGRSILLVPLDRRRCLEATALDGEKPILVRANLVETGILFSGRLDIRLSLQTGPFLNPACRLRDFFDARTLQVGRFLCKIDGRASSSILIRGVRQRECQHCLRRDRCGAVPIAEVRRISRRPVSRGLRAGRAAHAVSPCCTSTAFQNSFRRNTESRPALIRSYSRISSSARDSSFWFINRARLIIALIRRYFPSPQSIFEIGCGTGHVLLALRQNFPSAALAGSDLYLGGLTFARGRVGPDIALIQMDARNVPVIEQFDVIGVFDVIEHIADDQRVLDQIYAALKPNGGVVIAVPQHPWLWSQADMDAHHQRRYRGRELEAKLINAGFRIHYSTSFNALLLPLMIASRMTGQTFCALERGAKRCRWRKLAIPSWLNGILSLWLPARGAYYVADGRTLAVGGSRLVVARRP